MTSNPYVILKIRPLAVMISKRQKRSAAGLMRDYRAVTKGRKA